MLRLIRQILCSNSADFHIQLSRPRWSGLGASVSGFLLSLLSFACDENPINRASTFSEPETSVITASISTVQSGTITLNWSGTARDGFVGGYMISLDSTRWGTATSSAFTTRQDSTFRLSFFSIDTTFTLFVASCRLDNGNKVYDTALIRGNLNFGIEPFIDANANNRYDIGENFTDIGSIDLTPAKIVFPVRNRPPVISRRFTTLIPDSTYPVTLFEFSVSDADGSNTLRAVELALNDSTFQPQNVVSLPVSATQVDVILESAAPRDTTVSEANVYIGTSTTPLGTRLKNYRLNQANVLYARALDVPGTYSSFIRVPSQDSVWVPRSVRATPLAVIDDFAAASRDPFDAFNSSGAPFVNERVLPRVFENIRGGKYVAPFKYETVIIQSPTISGISPAPYTAAELERFRRQVQQYRQPNVLTKILRLFDVVFWYTDGSPSYGVAQNTLPFILNLGIDVFMTAGSLSNRDATSLSFSPASASSVIIRGFDNPFSVQLSNDVLAADTSSYPRLTYNGNENFRALDYAPSATSLQFSIDNPTDIQPLYSLPSSFPLFAPNAQPSLDSTSRFVISRRIYRQGGQERGRLVFSSLPLYRTVVTSTGATDTTGLRRLYDAIFAREFGQ